MAVVRKKVLGVVDEKEFFKRKTLAGNARVKIGGEILSFTNLDKVYFPDDGFTKGDVIRYYYAVARYILPYLKDRPLILKRYPNGIDAQPFYQHNLPDAPDFVETFKVVSSDSEAVHYALAQDVATLLYIVNLGTIAQNPFHSRIGSVSTPDYFVFDLDPGDGATYKSVCTIAMKVKEVLDELGLKAYPKTSGSTGIHIYVPVKPQYTYSEIVDFSKAVATLVANTLPKIATVERMTRNRKKEQVYVDYLQNIEGKSIASSYSVREKPGATVSTPLTWAEVKKCTPISKFTIETMAKRLKARGDLFQDVLKKRQSLTAARKKLKAML